MPDNPKYDAIARQWQLLKLLPGAPGRGGRPKSAMELQQLLALEDSRTTSKRTIERDLLDLSRLFAITTDDAHPRGWHWMPGRELDLPSLELGDALALSLLEQFLRPLLPAEILDTLEARFQLAKSKLKALSSQRAAARWLDKVKIVSPTLNLQPPTIKPGVLALVQQALFTDRQLELDYHSVDRPAAKTLLVHPLGLVQRGPGSYLVASVFDYEDPRLFALHRIRSASLLDAPIKAPRDFSLDAYIASGALEFGDGDPIKLRAQISPALARHLTETPLSTDMQLRERGDHVQLSASLRDTWALRWWILSQGANFVVQNPVVLKRDLLEAHRAAAAAYAGSVAS